MIFNFKNKNFKRGTTLVELIVAIAIIAIFSVIVIANFPRIKKQFSLSRATYKLAQDIRRAEDLGLSGSQAVDGLEAKGYGFYVDDKMNNKEYLIYADTNDPADSRYTYYGDDVDYIIETIDFVDTEPGVFIERMYIINSVGAEFDITLLSINFSPPNPDITIVTDAENIYYGEDVSNIKKVGIVLSLDTDQYSKRTIFINSSGLIEIE